MTSLDDLFLDLLHEMHFAERQTVKMLAGMARAARNAELREAFRRRSLDSSPQARLREVFRLIGQPARGESSEAILGLLQDCGDLLTEATRPDPIHDARLLACGQALAHHQISRYGTLLAWAHALERADVANLLRQTRDAEQQSDMALARLAAMTVNREARAAA